MHCWVGEPDQYMDRTRQKKKENALVEILDTKREGVIKITRKKEKTEKQQHD